MFQMPKHIKSCDSSSAPTPLPPWFPVRIGFSFLESLYKWSNSTYALMDWHFFLLGFFFSSSTLDTHKESVPFVADWFYPRRCCILSTNWLLDGPVVCLQFLSVTAQAACLFTHVFLGSHVLIALKEFMGVIISETLIFIRRQTLLGGGASDHLCLLLFLSVYFMGVWWVNVSQCLYLPWAEVPTVRLEMK